MVSKRDILELLEELEGRGEALRAYDLARRYRLPEEDAARRLERLWYEQLIESTRARPYRARFRRFIGERVQDMSFRLTPRGRGRLEWYRAGEEDEGGGAEKDTPLFR